MSDLNQMTEAKKSFLSKISESQAAVLAAVIAAIVSLFAAGISVWSTVYTNDKSKEIANHNMNLTFKKEQSDKTLSSFDGALKSIRNLKNKIQDVIADNNISVENAEKSLREASDSLNKSFDQNNSQIRASDAYVSKSFHDTKGTGRRSWTNLQGENEQKSSKLTLTSRKELEDLLKELTAAETELQLKYEALIANPRL